MGTRRSRHNKGVKPFYKEHRHHLVEVDALGHAVDKRKRIKLNHQVIASLILARPEFWGGHRLDTYRTWTQPALLKLQVLCEADADPEGSADALGRKPSTLAHKAIELGFTLPREWRQIIAKKRAGSGAPLLSYPYVAKATDKHADLLAVNAIVPRSLPENMRADICQEVMVAIYEGRTTIDALKARQGTAAYYTRKFYKDNYEQDGRSISFSVLEDDARSYDEIASSIAAKDWHHDQIIERQRYATVMQTYTPPTQFEAAWQDQVGRTQIAMHDLGQFLSRDEVEELLEQE